MPGASKALLKRLRIKPETAWAIGLYMVGVLTMAVVSYGLRFLIA
ncbi:DUF2474 domain-containing protein [Pseudomonas sp. L13]|nr:DUF2474 domain-containing protein [Pseudomonas sp. L13]